MIHESRGMIERQLPQMVRLVDDLLDLSRVRRGLIELRTDRVELRTVIQRRRGDQPAAHGTGGTRAHRQLARRAHMAACRPDSPAQVFSNLLNNAAKYTERGGHIRLLAEPDGSRVTVRVRDDGVGISPEMLPRIFEMFTQVDQTIDRAQGGLGIGLTLVKRLVEMHGGCIEAHSDGPNRGSEFVVRLPRLEILAAAAARRRQRPPRRRSPGPANRGG